MLTVIRRHRKGVLQVVFFVLILAFLAGSVVVYGSRNRGDERTDVATVNGEPIPFERYQRRYQQYVNAYARMVRGGFSPEMAERLGLKQQVREDLIQEAVIVQRARAEGIDVTDEELNARIHVLPAFQENGRFSLSRYREVLRANGRTETQFEQDVRRDLVRRKIETIVRSGVKVSDAEVEHAFTLRREEVRAQWALVEIGPLGAAMTASDGELQTYLREHGTEFHQPERRRVQYVTVGVKDFVRPVAEAEVEKYYVDRAAEFETPRQVRVSHVLVRVPETGGSEAEDRARAKVADAIRRVKAGEAFAKLARELSEDRDTAVKGGEIGFMAKGEVAPEVEPAVFSLKKGEIFPEPLRTPAGYHAIMVSDIREGGRKPLAAVATQIRDRLSAEAAERAAKAKAEEVKSQLQAVSDFMAEARKLHLTAVETALVKTERLSGLPGGEPLAEAAFSLALGGVSAPVKTPAGFVVLKTIEALPAGVPPLAEIKDTVAAAVKRHKADALALERAKQIAAEAKTGDLGSAAKKIGARTGETGRFSRAMPAERLPGDAMLVALQTPTNEVATPVKAPSGYYVLKVLERVPPDLGGLTAERDKLARELLVQKQSQVWESWVSGARARAKVDVSARF